MKIALHLFCAHKMEAMQRGEKYKWILSLEIDQNIEFISFKWEMIQMHADTMNIELHLPSQLLLLQEVAYTPLSKNSPLPHWFCFVFHFLRNYFNYA